MAESSSLSRYRPAVLTVVGLAAGYGIYTLYTAFADHPGKSPLQRRNAVHRHRRDRQNSSRGSGPTDNRAELDESSVGDPASRDLRILRMNLDYLELPGSWATQQMLSEQREDSQRVLEIFALQAVVMRCLSARFHTNTEFYERAVNLGLGPFLEALRARDTAHIRRHLRDVPRILNLTTVTDEQIEQGLHGYLSSHILDNLHVDDLHGSADIIEHIDSHDSNSDGNGNAVGEVHTDVDAAPAETEELDVGDNPDPVPSQDLSSLLYYIAEEEAKRRAVEHRGIQCEECGQIPIAGVRWHCLNCPDFDLCSSCEAHTLHPKSHVFAKIAVPIPILSQPSRQTELWYPGDPHRMPGSLDPALRKLLCAEHNFDDPQIDAFFDQFSCLANADWSTDPAKIGVAIDRTAFRKAMQSSKWHAPGALNVMFDRMFAFYDTDGNELIGFIEFIQGLSYLRGPKRFASLHRAIKGYDLDNDGLVDRQDFLRLLRAKYAVHRLLIRESVELQEWEHTSSGMSTLKSSQPISSIFSQEDIPPGEDRPRAGKLLNPVGDLEPIASAKTILGDDDESLAEMARDIATKVAERVRRPVYTGDFEQFASSFDEHMSRVTPQTGAPVVPVAVQTSNDNSSTPANSTALHKATLDPDVDSPKSTLYERALSQFNEAALNELLDPIFLAREHEDAAIIRTMSERRKWHAEIAAARDAHNVRLQNLHTRAEADPLVAAAAAAAPPDIQNSELTIDEFVPARTVRSPQPSHSPVYTTEIVSTDDETLARREAQIAQQPLEVLLSATGYGDLRQESEERQEAESLGNQEEPARNVSADDPVSNTAADPTAALAGSAGPHANITPNPNPPSPPLPTSSTASQPSSPSKPHPSESIPIDSSSIPTNQHLLTLARLSSLEPRLTARGNVPGRLTYAEIEALAASDPRKPLRRDLIKGWLEWAAFM